MKQLLRKILTGINRTLSFGSRARNYFFILLQEYYASNFAPLETFTHMEKSALNRAIRQVSKISRANIYASRPFSHGYAASYYFTDLEETLLKLGEQHGSLPNVIRIIMRTDSFRNIPMQVIKDSLQWIAITIIVLWMSDSSASGLRRIAGDYGWFFDMASLFMTYILPASVIIICVSPLYFMFRSSALAARDMLSRIGMFKLHNAVTEYRVLSVLKELTSANIPPADLMDVLLQVFHGEKWLTVRVRRAKAQLRTRTYMEVLEHIISPQLYSHVAAAAPNRQPDEIAKGMNSACVMLELQVAQTVSVMRGTVTAVTALGAFGIMLPFMLITLGAAGGDEFSNF